MNLTLMRLHVLRQPEFYDVVVVPNMFGDIVTDLASALQGGMGMASKCEYGDHHMLFEPVHGSTPKRAGKGSESNSNVEFCSTNV